MNVARVVQNLPDRMSCRYNITSGHTTSSEGFVIPSMLIYGLAGVVCSHGALLLSLQPCSVTYLPAVLPVISSNSTLLGAHITPCFLNE